MGAEWSSQRIPLTPVDAAWFRAHSANNQMVIRGMIALAGPVDRDLFEKTLHRRLAPFERFHQRIVDSGRFLARPYWEDAADFDISNHVTWIETTESELDSVLSDLAVVPLDLSLPAWHAHVISLDSGRTVAFFRIHHSIGDGQALVHVLLSLCDPVSSEAGIEDDRRRDPRWRASGVTEVPDTPRLTLLRSALAAPATWGRSIAIALAKLLVLIRLLLLPPDTETILRGRLGAAKRLAWSPRLPLEAVRSIAHQLGITINDVLLSCMAGAVARYTATHGTPVGERDVRAMVPVDVRPRGVVPDMGNRFGLVVASLPTGIDDTIDRAHEMSDRMTAIKRRPEAGVGYGVIRLLGFIPKALEGLVVRFFAAKTSLVMTNVVGPRDEQQLAGTVIDDLLVWVPQSGSIGLGVALFSYAGNVRVTVMTDKLRVPDAGELAQHFADEFERLSASVAAATPPPRS